MTPSDRRPAQVRGAMLWLLAASWVAAPAASEDPRSVEVLRHACESEIGRSDLTLFANGTLRLREEMAGEEPRMRLAELGRVDLGAYLARLSEEELSEVREGRPEAGGDWVERCELLLALPGAAARSFRYARMDSLPLALGRLLRVVADMRVEVEDRAPRSRLPEGYEPRSGDTLRRLDGTLFQVITFTGDGAGLELEAVDGSLVLYIPIAALRDEFEELMGRRP